MHDDVPVETGLNPADAVRDAQQIGGTGGETVERLLGNHLGRVIASDDADAVALVRQCYCLPIAVRGGTLGALA